MNKRDLEAKRIVIKIGTSSLLYQNTSQLNLRAIERLAFVLSDLKNQGKEVVLVSSGAIGVGMGKLGLTKRPETIPAQQAVASVGQGELLGIYEREFQNYGKSVAQMLLTRDVLVYPQSKKNVFNAFQELLKLNVIPIVNENDTVSVDELDHKTKFGDNDQLSAVVADLINADLLIMLSDIDGFYSSNPLTDPNAELYHTVTSIDSSIIQSAGGRGTKFGTGGMVTKLKAAKRILSNNQKMVLANGENPRIIYNILAGEPVGTLFEPKQVATKEGLA
ncbi:glutamate 5-kinase [Pediococcus inopinatus]|uniref:Glutamate 5-kinase n=1 Tax=Pediococcus inopinatus TaxID=114090 RepID=A0ABZ0Q5E9_9LACO|nr:glutamate 5-kinase [Pediococcus inopinatus]AVK99411.1 glutamate 5-kinase [Pediococcus inopinatus]WPC17185.1 glutamate 5-kinase [Pediococcus inopinatus]WPC20456.1 glutamate 5-kinase [Pediococcus inopinatus]WPC22162.1 glutamate 5-kinase [Pediococcus inopinatus]